MAAKKKTVKKTEKVSSSVAKSNDGSIQLTFKIPFKEIKSARNVVAKELGKDIQISGFRKGKAPLSKVLAQVPPATLIDKTLQKVLPELLAKALTEHKIKPVILPKFELISAKENEDWQVRAVTCERPTVSLGDYKKIVTGAAKSQAIWTPGKGEEKEKKEPSREEKEQQIMKILLESISLDTPKPMIEHEVTRRLSALLERIEKLGLTLESYLASIGKTPETLRQEYEKQAEELIKLDLVLDKVADEEKIKIEGKQIEAAMAASSADPNMAKKLDTPEQRRLIEFILRRRAALDALVKLL